MSVPQVRRIAAYTALILAVWLADGAALVCRTIYLHGGEGHDSWFIVVRTATKVLSWATFTPFVLYAITTWPSSRTPAQRLTRVAMIVSFVPACLTFQTLLASGALKVTLVQPFTDYVNAALGSVHTNAFPLLGVTAASLWVSSARQREREQRDEVELRREVAQMQLQQLRADLEPHFIFNALNTVAALTAEDPDRAEQMLRQVLALLDRSLQIDLTADVSLEEEIAFAVRYLDIQRIRFGERLTTSVEMAASLRRLRVPPLILQPLVENAVRHGIARSHSAGAIAVRADADERRLILEVRDTGPGFDLTRQTVDGIGIENVRKRLRLLFDEQQSLTFRREAGHFAARIEMPATWSR